MRARLLVGLVVLAACSAEAPLVLPAASDGTLTAPPEAAVGDTTSAPSTTGGASTTVDAAGATAPPTTVVVDPADPADPDPPEDVPSTTTVAVPEGPDLERSGDEGALEVLPVLGHQRVAALFVTSAADPYPLSIDEAVEPLRTTATDMVRTFSYGATTVEVDPFGWYQFTPENFCEAMSGRMLRGLHDPSLEADPPDLAGYDVIAVVVEASTMGEFGDPCFPFAGGIADGEPIDLAIGGSTWRARWLRLWNWADGPTPSARGPLWMDGSNATEFDGTWPYTPNPFGEPLTDLAVTFVHEFLHTQGLSSHANATRCAGRLVTGDCGSEAYDPFDLMGYFRSAGLSLSANARVRLGWLTPDRYVTVSESGTHTVGGINDPDGVVAARIDVEGWWGDELWLEHRPAGPWDYPLVDPKFTAVAGGLLVHTRDHLLDTRLLNDPPDDEPIVADLYGAGVDVGFEIRDLGITVSDIRHDGEAGTVTFDVRLDGTEVVHTTPVPVNALWGCHPDQRDWNWNECTVAPGEGAASDHHFLVKDVGLGNWRNLPFAWELVDAPFAFEASEVERMRPDFVVNGWADAPGVRIWFDVPAGTPPGDHDYEFRYWNPDDPSLAGRYPQRITVTG